MEIATIRVMLVTMSTICAAENNPAAIERQVRLKRNGKPSSEMEEMKPLHTDRATDHADMLELEESQ
uniref:Uncharacterized protein n=1 Tax=Pristionchus pacificus TaxID=54126 RepID=A0A2A6D380_PRIPA|eukprot:PDM84796.1 hypothetical protein PRIPAC_33819 [Pristionchus pacificus]